MIERQYRVVPLEKQHGIPKSEKLAIREYVDEWEITEGVFLFSMDALECTRAIAQVMPSESLLLMMDYTLRTDVVAPGEYEGLLTSHFFDCGMHLFQAVSTNMMQYVLSRSCVYNRNLWRIIRDNAFLNLHSLFVFYHGKQSMALDSILQSWFPINFKILERFPAELFPANNGGRMAPYTKLENWTHYSPYHLWWATHNTWNSSDPEQVAALLDLLEEQFGGPNPKTLFSRAMLAVHQGKSQQAMEILDELAKSVPLFEDPHVERILILSKMLDTPRLIQAIRDYISVTSETDLSGLFLELVKLYHQTDNSRMANGIISHMANQDAFIRRF
jgi:hypothetical protein